VEQPLEARFESMLGSQTAKPLITLRLCDLRRHGLTRNSLIFSYFRFESMSGQVRKPEFLTLTG
jgi:hypothetical protein